MRALRGRPRNISESGIVYLDSEGEESEYSDSDVEPVFFPAAEIDLEEAFAGENVDDDDVDGIQIEHGGQDANANRGRFFQLILDSDEDDSSSDDDDDGGVNNAGLPVVGGPEVHRSVIQYFGGTVQVRHIVHENFTQLQQQQQQGQSSSVVQEAAQVLEGQERPEGSSSSSARQGEEEEEESEGEPPSICESEIVIRVRVDDESVSVEVPRRMTEQFNEHLHSVQGLETQTVEEGQLAEQKSTAEPCKEGDEETANCSSGSSGLVPYPDLPDYASAGEEEDEEFLKASIPAPYKSPTESAEGPSSSSVRLSVKRKEPDSEEEENQDHNSSVKDTKSSRKRTVEKMGRRSSLDGEEEEEETCNPMASDEEYDETEEAFRGDRIGNTVYSERHVLKILMKWVEELPNYSIETLLKAREKGEVEEEIETRFQKLDSEFEEQMSLLWDMSSETDVMRFLVENKIFPFIRDTIERSACNRLTEIALGILANVISEPSIVEDFTVHDSSIQLVEKVVDLCTKVSDVAVLIQVFSVLRRIVWYLRNVSPVKKWTILLQSPSFLGCSNFIMSSSRNALLLGNVMMLFFTLLDFLNPDTDEDDTEEHEGGDPDTNSEAQRTSSSSKSSSEIRQRLAQNFEPFCESEFVPAICEALKELMKNPKPPSSLRNLSSTREKPIEPGPSSGCRTDDHCPNADDVDIPIPEGHVQQAILKGISTLALLQKAPNGQDSLKRNAQQVINVLLTFYRTFTVCTEAVTRSNSLEYFALSLHLLSFCHTSLENVNQDAIVSPISTASKLMSREEKDKEVDMVIRVQLKDGVEFDSVSYIALVAHEYLAAVAERFGPDSTLKARRNKTHDKFFTVLDQVLGHFNDKNNDGSNNCLETNEKVV